MKLFGLVECRSIRQVRVQLGDPSQDVWEYQVYSFLGHKDFDLEMRDFTNGDEACIIARKKGLLELGGQYLLSISDEAPGAALWCLEMKGDVGRLKTLDHSDAEWWTCTRLTVRSKQPLTPGGVYYLAFAPAGEEGS